MQGSDALIRRTIRHLPWQRGGGSNLSGVAHTLRQDEAKHRGLLDFVEGLPEQDITRIDFRTTEPRRDVMLQLFETFGGREQAVEAALLSDGTLRVLAIAAALLSAPEGSMVVIEEIDNGVHPSRAGSLLERIQSVARARSLQVLLTTHLPALMDALPDEALRRRKGERLVEIVRDALQGRPGRARVAHAEPDQLANLRDDPADRLMQAGSFADASLIAIKKELDDRRPARRVRIPSVDRHRQGDATDVRQV